MIFLLAVDVILSFDFGTFRVDPSSQPNGAKSTLFLTCVRINVDLEPSASKGTYVRNKVDLVPIG